MAAPLVLLTYQTCTYLPKLFQSCIYLQSCQRLLKSSNKPFNRFSTILRVSFFLVPFLVSLFAQHLAFRFSRSLFLRFNDLVNLTICGGTLGTHFGSGKNVLSSTLGQLSFLVKIGLAKPISKSSSKLAIGHPLSIQEKFEIQTRRYRR